MYVVLTLTLFLGLNAYGQEPDGVLFKQNFDLLESQINNYYSADADTAKLRSDALTYIVDVTNIEPEPWVDFTFVIPYCKNDLEKWSAWAVKNGIL